jgi:hypothetical protein
MCTNHILRIVLGIKVLTLSYNSFSVQKLLNLRTYNEKLSFSCSFKSYEVTAGRVE